MGNDLMEKIERLKDKRQAAILAHNYQIGEVQDIADYVGDSLELSRKAADLDAAVIVFCGVDFMAESAAILSPEKTVLIPQPQANCPLAEMITVDQLRQKQAEYPDARTVCYVNSSAAVKAASDICCTSSNAVEIVNRVDSDRVIFVPDNNLGHYVSRYTEKTVIRWPGYCITHHRNRAEDVDAVRQAHPDAAVIVHPECRPEVVDRADYVGSTAKLLEYARQSDRKTLIIGTEMGILHRMQQENPDKKFYLLNQGLICRSMKLTTLSHVAGSLENMQQRISVEENLRIRALESLDLMLKLRA